MTVPAVEMSFDKGPKSGTRTVCIVRWSEDARRLQDDLTVRKYQYRRDETG